jgi:sugar O-acyltransferase (sialic acid O-acetyltransferase NeuD family)
LSVADSELSLYIVGAGGHGRELCCYIEDLHRAGWRGELRGYLDDGLAVGLHGRLQVLGTIGDLEELSGVYITAVGSNSLRREIVSRVAARHGRRLCAWTLIHPRSYVGSEVAIGEGTCIAPGAIVTTKINIGSHCVVNINASLSHDCKIGDYVNINPGAAVCGSVTIGEGAFIGAGAIVKECVSIGAWSVVGAGAVVVRDIPANVTAIGVPARVVSRS